MTTTPTPQSAPAPVAPAGDTMSLSSLFAQWRLVLMFLGLGAGVGGFGNQALGTSQTEEMAKAISAIKTDIAVLKNDVGTLKSNMEKCQ